VSENVSTNNGAHHIKFERLFVFNGLNDCVLINIGSGGFIWFDSGHYQHCGWNNGNPIQGVTGYPFYVSGNDHILENMDIEDSPNIGINVYESNTPPLRIIVRSNVVHRTGLATSAFGILVKGSDHLVANNIVQSCIGRGIVTWNETAATNTKIYNNTVDGCTDSGIHVGSNMSGALVRNNMSTFNGGGGFTNNGSSTTFGFNLCTSSGTGCTTVSPTPNYVDRTGTFDFHLQSTSPAINAGTTLTEVPLDFEGTVRPQGAAYDIGADEVLAAGPPPDTTPPGAPTGLTVE
jgi:hypothetical protein